MHNEKDRADVITPQILYDILLPLQKKQGYYFNDDRQMTMDILEQLLVNKNNFGYMVCPCRLAAGNRESDKDIICPCVYRAADVQEYGSCYCGLYVSAEWNEKTIPHRYVPERRPQQPFNINKT